MKATGAYTAYAICTRPGKEVAESEEEAPESEEEAAERLKETELLK